MLRRIITWTVFVGLTCDPGVARLPAAEAGAVAPLDQHYHVLRWTSDQGLPQNRVSCLKQTRDGYLWVGTWFGLARFDGVRFTLFNHSNTPELADDTINELAEDGEGTLWVATLDGLVSYRDHQFHRFAASQELPAQEIRRLVVCRAGGLWVQAGPDSVARVLGGKVARVFKFPPSDDGILALHEGADGSLQVFLEQSWMTLSPGAEEPQKVPLTNSLAPNWIRGLVSKHPGRAWVSTQQELVGWDQGVLRHFGPDQFGGAHADWQVDFLFEDRSTNVWVNVLPGALFRQSGDHWKAVDLGISATPTPTKCMEEDFKGNFWVGTDNGLIQLRRGLVRSYTTREGLPDDQVWTVCEANDGTIWLGTHLGLSRIQDGRVSPVPPADQLADEFRALWPSPGGGVRAATRMHGVYELAGKLNLLLPTNNLPNRKVTALYEDRQGRLWIGTQNGVAVFKDGHITESHTNWIGRSACDVRCILEDRDGTFWFGTQGQGLTRFRNGTFEIFTKKRGLCSDSIWSLYEDADGALWLGTEDGLMRYRSGHFFSFSRKEGLREDTVNWILEDNFGYFWLSGLSGIYRVSRGQLNQVAEGHARAAQFAVFGTDEGMESSETNGENQPAGWKARDGRLWFPTARGVVVIDPAKIQTSDSPSPVVIEQMKADDEVVFGDPTETGSVKKAARKATALPLVTASAASPVLRLPAGRAQSVEIAYTANNFAHAPRTQFRYRLIGRDPDWREETTARTAHYTNLRPGEYHFEVMAANHYGVWNLKPTRLSFSLAPHFYETWMFYALCVAAAVGLAAGVQSYRLRWQRRILGLEQDSAIAKERTRIARDLHDDLGTALTGLALELDVVRREASALPKVVEHLGATSSRTRDLAARVREVVWTVNPECDTVSSFAGFLEQQISQYLRATDLRVTLNFPEDIPAAPLSAEARYQLALSVREALANAVRHAKATEVAVSLAIVGETLVVEVKDNGRGFESQEQRGHGLANIRQRMAQVGGRFEYSSQSGAGTVIKFRVPLRPTVLRRKPTA